MNKAPLTASSIGLCGVWSEAGESADGKKGGLHRPPASTLAQGHRDPPGRGRRPTNGIPTPPPPRTRPCTAQACRPLALPGRRQDQPGTGRGAGKQETWVQPVHPPTPTPPSTRPPRAGCRSTAAGGPDFTSTHIHRDRQIKENTIREKRREKRDNAKQRAPELPSEWGGQKKEQQERPPSYKEKNALRRAPTLPALAGGLRPPGETPPPSRKDPSEVSARQRTTPSGKQGPTATPPGRPQMGTPRRKGLSCPQTGSTAAPPPHSHCPPSHAAH